LEILLRVEDGVAQPVRAGDHLTTHQRAKTESNAEPDAGHEIGQRGGKNDVADHRHAPSAQRLHGLYQDRLNHTNAGQQIVQHWKEHRHDNDERDGALTQAKP
jgi:hypothetical protein